MQVNVNMCNFHLSTILKRCAHLHKSKLEDYTASLHSSFFILFLSSFLLHFCCLRWFSNLFGFLYSALAVNNSLAIISHPLKINEHSLRWRRSTLLSSTTSFADFEWKQQWTTLVLSSMLHPRPTRVAWKPIEGLKPQHLDCYSPSPQVQGFLCLFSFLSRSDVVQLRWKSPKDAWSKL